VAVSRSRLFIAKSTGFTPPQAAQRLPQDRRVALRLAQLQSVVQTRAAYRLARRRFPLFDQAQVSMIFAALLHCGFCHGRVL
jgi:hypothetical protein